MKNWINLFVTFIGLLIGFIPNVYATENGYFEKIFPAPENPAPGELSMTAEWRIWIPEGVVKLRGIVVHQHGCGNGSGDTGRTGVYDLQWQELARKHDCALVASSFRLDERPCEQWCDPRNGSAQSFFDALEFFAEYTGHDELTTVPWALWGHSGGGQWVGSMTQLYPRRVVAAWLRSGCPDTVVKTADELPMNSDFLNTPMFLNIGAREFDISFVWNSCWDYYCKIKAKNAKIGLLIDPVTHHETGASRYPAIRFLDEMLSARLPVEGNELLPAPKGQILPIDEISDQELSAVNIVKDSVESDNNFDAAERREFLKDGLWFPNSEFISVWRRYSVDASIDDVTPPPAPTDVRIVVESGVMAWNCRGDLESGLKEFIIYCDGNEITRTTTAPVINSRPVFQGLTYSDTPDFSLPKMEIQIPDYASSSRHEYAISSVNTVGLESERRVASFVE